MALTKAQVKEILSEAGADGEKIADAVQKILDGHVATIEALKEERDSLKKEIEANKADLEEYEKLKKNNGDIEALRKEYDDFKANVEAEKIKAKKETAYREILKDVGIPERHFPKILKYSDVNGIEFDEEGNVKGADEIRKNIEAEWSDHIEKKMVESVKTPNPPSNGGTKTTMTREQIRAIPDAQARQKAMIENASLFGLPE